MPVKIGYANVFYRKDLVTKVAEVLQAKGSKHALVVHSHDGMDEFSVSAPTYVAELVNDTIREYEIMPEDVGLRRHSLKSIVGGFPEENAMIIKDIFSGKNTGACLDVVLLNTAAGLLVADMVSDLQEGVEYAREAIMSRKALGLLNEIVGGMR